MASVAIGGATGLGAGAAGAARPRLTADQLRLVERLRARDAEVRAHEAAHRAAGGQLAGPARFSYQLGPDGRSYAVGGEVSISMGGGGDADARIARLRLVRAAALAPARPSAQDLAVAAQAMQAEAQARAERAAQRAGTAGEEGQRQEGQRAEGQRAEDRPAPAAAGGVAAAEPSPGRAGSASSAAAEREADDGPAAGDGDGDGDQAAPRLPAEAFSGSEPLRRRRQAEVAALYRRLERGEVAGTSLDRTA